MSVFDGESTGCAGEREIPIDVDFLPLSVVLVDLRPLLLDLLLDVTTS